MYHLVMLILATVVSVTFAAGKEHSRDVGLQIGERIPEFSLHDQFGQPRNIKDLVGENGAVIDFYRSASW